MAKCVRFDVKRETHKGDNVFLIHRPFIFSNPFTHIKDKKTLAKYVVDTKEESIRLYAIYFDEMINKSEEFRNAWNSLYEAYKTFDTIYIGCYCNVDDICHGDVIIEKLKKRAMRDMLEKLREKKENAT